MPISLFFAPKNLGTFSPSPSFYSQSKFRCLTLTTGLFPYLRHFSELPFASLNWIYPVPLIADEFPEPRLPFHTTKLQASNFSLWMSFAPKEALFSLTTAENRCHSVKLTTQSIPRVWGHFPIRFSSFSKSLFSIDPQNVSPILPRVKQLQFCCESVLLALSDLPQSGSKCSVDIVPSGSSNSRQGPWNTSFSWSGCLKGRFCSRSAFFYHSWFVKTRFDSRDSFSLPCSSIATARSQDTQHFTPGFKLHLYEILKNPQ